MELINIKIKVEKLGNENDHLKTLCRFLAQTHTQWHKIIFKNLSISPELLADYLINNLPMIQGTQNQLNIKKIGDQEYDKNMLHKAVKMMLNEDK